MLCHNVWRNFLKVIIRYIFSLLMWPCKFQYETVFYSFHPWETKNWIKFWGFYLPYIHSCSLYYSLALPWQFILDVFLRSCVPLANNQSGCCVFQDCLRYFTGQNRINLIEKVTANGLALSQDKYGYSSYCYNNFFSLHKHCLTFLFVQYCHLLISDIATF